MAAFSILVILVVAVIGTRAVATPSTGSTRAGPFPFSEMGTEVLYNSSLGLRLQLEIAPLPLNASRPIYVSIMISNTLPTLNRLSFPSGPPFGLRYYDCGPDGPPLGIFVFEGNYAGANLSEGLPLRITLPGVVSCPQEISVDHYLFAPLSDQVSLYSSQEGNAPHAFLTTRDSTELKVGGYWTGIDLPGLETAQYHPFSPGSYTVVGLDPWGDVAILHFSVDEGSTNGCASQPDRGTAQSVCLAYAGPEANPLLKDKYE